MRYFKSIFYLFCGILISASCNKQQTSVGPVDGTASVQFCVKGGTLLTKSEKTDNEKSVHSLSVAIYNASGVCEWSKTYSSIPSGNQIVTGLAEGQKTICACANFDYTPSVGDAQGGFTSLVTRLSDNSRDSFVMFGKVGAEAASAPKAVELKLASVAAKFDLSGKFILDWEGDAPSTFSITDIYLANVGSKSDFSFSGSYVPEVNPRKPGVVEQGYESLTLVSSDWSASGTPFGSGSVLYGYPNDGTTSDTYLIIKALYDGEVCYYPLNINDNLGEDSNGIESNHSYKFGDITITARGTDNPWDDFEKIKVPFSIIVKGWDDVQIENVVF